MNSRETPYKLQPVYDPLGASTSDCTWCPSNTSQTGNNNSVFFVFFYVVLLRKSEHVMQLIFQENIFT